MDSERRPGMGYKKGDFIGQEYQVYGVLGIGGCGVVYLVYSHETESVHALKTFRDEYLADAGTRERFRREAKVWVDLERHPYLVRAFRVDEVGGRLYIALEYIAPDEDGLNSLEGYLRRRPPSLVQSLRWSIQVCYGMEYAYSRGLRCHRDIKPANIMISQDGTVKISDFGLAGVFGTSRAMAGIRLSIQQGRVGLSGQTIEGTGFGTPTHMPPEQFTDAPGCDERSDIYGFGVVLYQMATGGKLPFLAASPRDSTDEEARRFWRAMYRLHSESPVPPPNSLLFPIVRRCLEKEPGERYSTFKELRLDLELLLKRQNGEVIKLPQLKELDAWEWSNKGVSLLHLGLYDEALRCCDRTLELIPQDTVAWNNKGTILHCLGRLDEALRCYDRALELDPQDPKPWYNKGAGLRDLGRADEAFRCYDRALELDPQNADAWSNKGLSLYKLGRIDEALSCYDKALELDSQKAIVWKMKGNTLRDLGRADEALRCYDRALELDPQNAYAWSNKGLSLYKLGRIDEALSCYDKALELDPQKAGAWSGRGASLARLGRIDEALPCFDRALELDPRDAWASNIKGASLREVGRIDEALRCYDKALEVDPRGAWTWYYKALAEETLGQTRDAARSFRRFIALAPAEHMAEIEYARQRLLELEGK